VPFHCRRIKVPLAHSSRGEQAYKLSPAMLTRRDGSRPALTATLDPVRSQPGEDTLSSPSDACVTAADNPGACRGPLSCAPCGEADAAVSRGQGAALGQAHAHTGVFDRDRMPQGNASVHQHPPPPPPVPPPPPGSPPGETGYEELWQCLGACHDQAERGKLSLKSLAGTLTQAGGLEDQHASQLNLFRRKNEFAPLLERSEDESVRQRSTLEQGLTSFGVMFWDNLVKSKVIVAQELATLGRKLESFRKEQKHVHRTMQAEVTRLDKLLDAQDFVLQRSRQKYLKACKDAERAVEARDRSRAGPEKAKLISRANVAMYTAFEAERLHRQVIDETRKAQLKHRSGREKLGQEFQVLEEARASRVRQTLERVAQLYAEQSEYVRTLAEKLHDVTQRVDVRADSEAFVAQALRASAEEQPSSDGPAGAQGKLAEFVPYKSQLLFSGSEPATWEVKDACAAAGVDVRAA